MLIHCLFKIHFQLSTGIVYLHLASWQAGSMSMVGDQWVQLQLESITLEVERFHPLCHLVFTHPSQATEILNRGDFEIFTSSKINYFALKIWPISQHTLKIKRLYKYSSLIIGHLSLPQVCSFVLVISKLQLKDKATRLIKLLTFK